MSRPLRQREGGHPRTSAVGHGPDRQHGADDDEAEQDREVDDGQDRLLADRPERQAARQPTPCHSGVIQASGWRIGGSDSTGKNVPREQEQRRDPEPEDRVEPLGRLLGRGERHDRRREREAGQRRDRDGQHDERRRGGPERDDDDREDRGDEQQPGADPGEVAERRRPGR